ncbi:hypothetical protein LshimejAT787_1700750 [Lyophyllum shimeji]|uniref:Uncharacterized protein n=1 Tax=Lyophyllum shimeji TaxID=47721 RepID=A0A9P3PZK6_LYOSH|nr:hypothetical protein LshimejAT787_1700750 [Lyophyllum shimeji]
MDDVLYEDIVSHILSYIYDSETLHVILRSVPPAHPLFILALKRLCQLPWPLSFDEFGPSDMFRAFDLLIKSAEPSTQPFPFVNALRHLVIESGSKKTALREGLVDLFRVTRNLRVLDWCGEIGPSKEELTVLHGHQSLEDFRVDCGSTTNSYSDESWEEIEDLVSTLGPSLTSLDLRKVNLKMYKYLESHRALFPSYRSLERLSLDLTEGVWDWNGLGSPQAGASSAFQFVNLGFPSVKEVEMRVGDLTISGERAGPMDLINWENLVSLGLFVDPCIFPSSIFDISLFKALRPSQFPSLARLEIRDTVRNTSPWKWPDDPEDARGWHESSRCYWGLVPHFLASVRSGFLPNLAHLWVNEKVLCMPKGSGPDEYPPEFYGVGELWTPTPGVDEDEDEGKRKREWVGILRDVLGRLESLRVGFGPMSARDVGLVLGCCSPDKLAQFGFQYKWEVADRESVIPSALLEHLSRLPKLADVHVLQIRPGTQDVYRSPLRSENGRTLDDIAAIFKSNPNVCRVGWGQNTVWERRSFPAATEEPDEFILAHDGFKDPRLVVEGPGAVPRFYDIGPIDAYYGEVQFEPRPAPTKEIRELKDLLTRILPSN